MDQNEGNKWRHAVVRLAGISGADISYCWSWAGIRFGIAQAETSSTAISGPSRTGLIRYFFNIT